MDNDNKWDTVAKTQWNGPSTTPGAKKRWEKLKSKQSENVDKWLKQKRGF